MTLACSSSTAPPGGNNGGITAGNTGDQGSGARLTGLGIVGDDFTSYQSTTDLHAAMSVNIGGTGNGQTALYHDGRGASQVTLDSTIMYNGHATMRYAFPAGGGPPEMWPSFPHPISDMWLRVALRFGPGFTTVGNNPNAANAYKLLGWGLAGVDGSGRIEITNSTQYELYWGAAVTNTSTPTTTVQFGFPGNVTTEWTDGKWYDYVIHYVITSDSTVTAETWIRQDGAISGLHAVTHSTMFAGYKPPLVYAANLGMNYNQPILKPMSLNYGQWEVVDGSVHPDPFHVAGTN